MTRQFSACLQALVLFLGGQLTLLAGTISGTFTPIPQGSAIDLTQTGKTDWVHWGLYTEGSVTRKAGVPALISNFKTIGTGVNSYIVAYQYSDNFNGYTWYDGWPVIETTNTTTGVWAYQAFPLNPMSTGHGFQIEAPADTTWRILHVYVGAFDARGQLKATMSDGGASYTDTSLANTSNGPGGVYTLNYRANSAGQKITVQWTLYQRTTLSNSPQANVTLQAAALTLTNANNPPLVDLTAPQDLATYPAPANIALSAVARDFDGTVTNVAFYAGPVLLSNSATAPYTFSWNSVGPGRYSITAVATDDAGGTRTTAPIDVHVYGSGGILNATMASAPPTVNLTSQGTADWFHWGLSTNLDLNRKAGVVPQLAVTDPPTTNGLSRFNDGVPSFSWTDGTPTASHSGTASGVYLTGWTDGFRFTAPADTTTRTLRVYVGGYGMEGRFEAYLSDFSAAPFTDKSLSGVYDTVRGVYELSYASASDHAQLHVSFRPSVLFDQQYGNVSFSAATLQGLPVNSVPLQIGRAELNNNQFSLSFQTEAGRTYTVQYTQALPASGWTSLPSVAGTGGTVTVADRDTTATQRFYRVIVE